MQPVSRVQKTWHTTLQPHAPASLPALPLSPKANTSASAAWWGKSLPAELDRSQLLCLPRQHPSLTRSLPLLALPSSILPLHPGLRALPEWAAGRARAGVGGHSRSGSPKGQCTTVWEAGLRGIQGSKISRTFAITHHPLPKVSSGSWKSEFPRGGGRGDALSPGGQKFGVLHA